MKTVIFLAIASFFLAAPAAVLAGGPDVNVTVSGYLPAPPGVHVYVDGGRPYYVERDRRVYVERDPEYGRHKHRRHRDHGLHKGWQKGHGKHKGRD